MAEWWHHERLNLDGLSKPRLPRLQHGWSLSIDVLSQLVLCLGVFVPAEEIYVKGSGQLSQLEA